MYALLDESRDAVMSAITTQRLNDLAIEIRATVAKGIQTAIDLGNLYLEARSLHPGDREFGQWCSDIDVLANNQKAIHRSMLLAQHFTGKDTGNIPLTGLYELAAPKNDDVRDEVVDKLLTNDSVTVKDVRQSIANAQPALPEPAPVATAQPVDDTDDVDDDDFDDDNYYYEDFDDSEKLHRLQWGVDWYQGLRCFGNVMMDMRDKHDSDEAMIQAMISPSQPEKFLRDCVAVHHNNLRGMRIFEELCKPFEPPTISKQDVEDEENEH